MNYKELAETYYNESFFYDNMDQFIKDFKIENKKLFIEEYTKIEKKRNEAYKKDRIFNEFKKNNYVLLTSNNNRYAIIHESPKFKGCYQCSIFAGTDAVADVQGISIMSLAEKIVNDYKFLGFEN